MAGRNKHHLRVIQGNARSKHITKNEMKNRLAHENRMRGPTEEIIAPPYLTAAQKKEFYELAEELLKLDIFSELETDVLARYLDSKYQYIQLVKDMRKIKPTLPVEDEEGNTHIVANSNHGKLVRSKNMLFNECRAAATDLGLTINARLKLVFPNNDIELVKTDAEKRFGNRL